MITVRNEQNPRVDLLPESEARKEYEPFDAQLELQSIRKIHRLKELVLSSDKKRQVRRQQLDDFKESLMRQKEGVAQIVRNLQEAIENDPNRQVESLMEMVHSAAPEYRLTAKQIAAFGNGLRNYWQKHEAVEKYRREFPNDNDLFEACFGEKPQGTVKVVKGPMTLTFTCFNPQDYDTAHVAALSAAGINAGDSPKYSETSRGLALPKCNIPELSGAVILVNARDDKPFTQGKEKEWVEKRTHLSDGESETIDLIDDFDRFRNVRTSIPTIGQWELRTAELDRGDVHMQLINSDRNNTQSLIDAELTTDPRDLSDFPSPAFKRKDSPQNVFSARILASIVSEGLEYAEVELESGGVKITEKNSPQGIDVRYSTRENVVRETQLSRGETNIHEEQHQFNKLFQPAEPSLDLFKVFRRIEALVDSPEAALSQLIYELVREQRGDIDSWARDEIIAHYSGGETADETYKNLSSLAMYDYIAYSKKWVAAIPQKVVNDLERKGLTVKKEDVQKHADVVFGQGYYADLKCWVDAITQLEQKNYTRQEIVSFLYQEPINRWPQLARRLPEKGVIGKAS